MKQVYEAYDGTIFKTRKECEEYEKKTCKYYHGEKVKEPTTDFERGYQMAKYGKYEKTKTVEIGHCWGTKDAERCYCKGDITKCTNK